MSICHWQKSSYSTEGANCVNVAARDGHILLRESDQPEAVIATTPHRLRGLLSAIKTDRIRQRRNAESTA